MDVQKIRKDFPILSRKVHGQPLVYLDNAATTQKPLPLICALTTYYQLNNANVHRGVHTLSEEATAQMEEARGKVAKFIGAEDPATVIFTRNTTESINLVAFSWARKNLKEGDEILLTEMEHHSNLVPWQLAAKAVGAKLRFIPVTGHEGLLDLSQVSKLLTDKTKLVAITHMSNALGTINPVKELAKAAHAAGALILVDGAQSVPHLPVRVKDLDCDFLAFSAHKMLGPTGVGVLWARREILEAMDPFLGGGDMISQVWKDHATWNELPYKFEAGTPNITGAIAFGVAIDYLEEIGMEKIRAHEMELAGYALTALKDNFPRMVLYGPADVALRGGVVSFNLPGVHPHDVGTIVDQDGVAIRVGHHCCQVLMKKFDIAGTARASFYIYNEPREVDALIRSLQKVERLFKAPASLPVP
ncbi:MAG: cysteine desulfurase [Elusimicrobia bacterium]|nr:cysteine desulfurase [Elusimicrobiota bacterium]